MWSGTWRGQSLSILQCGVGPEHAAATVRRLLQTSPPQRLLVAGLCGGLQAELAIGDVLLAETVQSAESGETLACTWLPHIPGVPPLGGLLSSQTLLATTAAKQQAAASTGCLGVDQESFAILQLARQFRIPCGVIRTISDSATDELPSAVARFVSPNGNLQLTAVITALLRNPALIPALLRLQQHSSTALRQLLWVLEQLPQS